MGNHVTIKGSERCSLVLEEFARLMLKCGVPATDFNLLHGAGPGMKKLVDAASSSKTLRAMQFTGSNRVANEICKATLGKVKIEDAGFNWKILGPDLCGDMMEYVSWMADQDLTVGPVLTETTDRILGHVRQILNACPGSRILFGGKELKNHSIPKIFGAVEPTAVFVPLDQILKNHTLVFTEIFGPFQIVTEWDGGAPSANSWDGPDLQQIQTCLEKMDNHLTACVCSNDTGLIQRVLASTVNGTTYCGIKGRTTGAPQNHWFGPCGDPRSAGIGSPEAIKLVWSGHREIISDMAVVEKGWVRPKTT